MTADRSSRRNHLLDWKPPIYWQCKHRSGDDAVCAAFPEGIPAAILMNKADHRQPFPGDHGIRFEPKDSDASKS